MAHYRPTPAELEANLGTVYDDIHGPVANAVVGTGTPAPNNTILESSLVRVRMLIDFFEPEPCGHDIISAALFAFPTTMLPIDQLSRTRMDTDLVQQVHFAATGAAAGETRAVARVIRPVLERCHAFIDHDLSPEFTGGRYDRNAWENLRSEVATRIMDIAMHDV